MVFDWLRKVRDGSTSTRYIYNSYFFRGRRYWMYENRFNRTRFGDPLYIRDGWTGLPPTVDTYVQIIAPSGGEYTIDTYFFSGMCKLEAAVLFTPTRDHHTSTVLRPFFRDNSGELVPEENFWTLWCKGRLTEADTSTIRLGATPSGLTSAHLHHLPPFFTGRMPILPPNQQCQSTEGNYSH